jgi:hypothetical protein
VSPAPAVAVAVTFGWLGMVLAISFIEAPLKFRAPGVTIRIGLGIGRLVFRALNAVEVVLAVALLAAIAAGHQPLHLAVAAAVPVALLAVQLILVRPRLNRRSDRVLAGEDAPRSHVHYVYVALEALKVAALLTAGAMTLAG